MIKAVVVFDPEGLLIKLANDLEVEFPNHVIVTRDLETAKMAVRLKATESPSFGLALIVTLPELNKLPEDLEIIETFARIKPDLKILVVMTEKVQITTKRYGPYDQGVGSQFLVLPVDTEEIIEILYS